MAGVDLFDEGAAAWPQLALDRAGFDEFVAARDDSQRHDGAELLLAYGCQLGDAAALALFDAHVLDVVPKALAHMKLAVHVVDEVRQQVREKLLIRADGADCKLVGYAGTGRLRGLVQVVAVRTAISELRKHKGGDVEDEAIDPQRDPELAFIKERYRGAFSEAFAAALKGLASRDRNILRLSLYGHLTVEQIANIYGVHRATATRWITRIRADILASTKRELGALIDAPPGELDSLIELLQSRLDVSVERLLDSE